MGRRVVDGVATVVWGAALATLAWRGAWAPFLAHIVVGSAGLVLLIFGDQVLDERGSPSVRWGAGVALAIAATCMFAGIELPSRGGFDL